VRVGSPSRRVARLKTSRGSRWGAVYAIMRHAYIANPMVWQRGKKYGAGCRERRWHEERGSQYSDAAVRQVDVVCIYVPRSMRARVLDFFQAGRQVSANKWSPLSPSARV